MLIPIIYNYYLSNGIRKIGSELSSEIIIINRYK